jgi:hypothetical protein
LCYCIPLVYRIESNFIAINTNSEFNKPLTLNQKKKLKAKLKKLKTQEIQNDVKSESSNSNLPVNMNQLALDTSAELESMSSTTFEDFENSCTRTKKPLTPPSPHKNTLDRTLEDTGSAESSGQSIKENRRFEPVDSPKKKLDESDADIRVVFN